MTRTRLLLVLVALGVTALPAAAQGQQNWRGRGNRGFGGSIYANLFNPEYLRRDLSMMNLQLKLNDGQKIIAEMNLLDYETAFEAAAAEYRETLRVAARRPAGPETEAMNREREKLMSSMRLARDKMRQARESGERLPREQMEEIRAQMEQFRDQMREMRPPMPDANDLVAMAGVMRDWRARRTALGADFIGSVQALLEDEQLETWPSVLRALRRQKTIGRGRLSGESVDLVLLVGQLELPSRVEETSALVTDYEIALDQALAVRNKQLEENLAESFSAVITRNGDQAVALVQREVAARLAVRNVNETFVEPIAESLAEGAGPEMAETFRLRFREAAFPGIHRTRTTERAFEAALALDGLTPEVLEAIQTLEQSYLEEVAAQNQVLEATTREFEPIDMTARARRRANREGWNRSDNPVRDAYEDRRALDRRYREQIEALLSPEQVERLPAERSRNRRGSRQGGERRGGFSQERRQEFMKQFDLNGDGEINESEREAIREHFRNGGGFGRDGGGFGRDGRRSNDGGDSGRRGRRRGGDDA